MSLDILRGVSSQSTKPVAASETSLLARADAAGQRLFRELVVSRIAWATVSEASRLIAVDLVAFSLRVAGCDHVQPCEQHHCLDRLELRAVLGNRGSRLPGLRLATGEGVGGRVLQTGKSFGVDRYARELAGEDHVDIVAGEEGISALVGVPVSFGGEVRGVLHVGLRGDRTFSERSITALTRLATYAGAALSAARDRSRVEEVAALRERRRLARALHDEFGQRLFGLGITARAARASAATGGADLIGHLIGLEQQVSGASAAFRQTLNSLARPARPSGMLAVMMREDLAAFTARAGVQAHMLMLGEPVALEADLDDLVVRILHEGLRNVERHAEAAEVVVTLAYDRDQVEIVVQDDGLGLRASTPFGGMGLSMLRDEVARCGGELRVSDNDDMGATMRARIPL